MTLADVLAGHQWASRSRRLCTCGDVLAYDDPGWADRAMANHQVNAVEQDFFDKTGEHP